MKRVKITMTSGLLVYFILVFLVFGNTYICDFCGEKGKKVVYWVTVVLLFTFAACRGNGNGDYFAYLEIGSDCRSLSDVIKYSSGIEISYRLLYFLLINTFGLHSQSVIIAMNFISIFFLSLFVYKYSCDRVLSLLCFIPFYMQFDMHAARIAVAISISLWGLKFLEQNFIKYALIILLASTFHITALIVLPLYFLKKNLFCLKTGVKVLVIETIFVKLVGVDKIILYILHLLGSNNVFYKKYFTYSTSFTYGYPLDIYDVRIILCLVIYIFAELFIDKRDCFGRILKNISFITVFVFVFFSEHTFFAYRLSAYFNIFSIISMPCIVRGMVSSEKISSKNILKVKMSAIIPNSVRLFSLVWGWAYVYTCFVVKNVVYIPFFMG